MFAYCNNNSTCRRDSHGRTSSIASVLKELNEKIEEIKLWAQDLVENYTAIELVELSDYPGYYSFTVEIESELFEPYSGSISELSLAASIYSNLVYNKIGRMALSEFHNKDFYLMSENHIYSELMVHLWGWFYAPKLLKLIYDDKNKDAMLNVSENRSSVLLLMWVFGYDGKEEYLEY